MSFRIGFIGLLLVQSCMAPRAEPATALDVVAFERESRKGLLVDVRTESEVADGMMGQSMSIFMDRIF